MDTNFHYYAISVLTQLAGFNERESDIIAYASQYVDDATEHKPISITGVPTEFSELYDGTSFNPTCTAHRKIQYLSSFKKDVQRKVYIAFHFIPDKFYTDGEYNYCVVPNGDIARELLDDGIVDIFYTHGKNDMERDRALIKTGIALHSYADTWAHHRFSGRHNSNDNDISNRYILKDDKWVKYSCCKELLLNILPDICHTEAAYLPDRSYKTWKYTHNASGLVYIRDNASIYADAAMSILYKLCSITGYRLTLANDIRAKLIKVFRSREDSLKKWSEMFPELSIKEYDDKLWRNKALYGNCDWDDFKKEEDFMKLNLLFNNDVKWFLFHVEAKNQREKVLNNIRFDLK